MTLYWYEYRSARRELRIRKRLMVGGNSDRGGTRAKLNPKANFFSLGLLSNCCDRIWIQICFCNWMFNIVEKGEVGLKYPNIDSTSSLAVKVFRI